MNTNINVSNENTYDVFFALLRSTLWGEERFPFPMDQYTPIDWDEICKELAWHAIHTLPTDLLCRVDSSHQPRYLMLASRSVSHWYAIMDAHEWECFADAVGRRDHRRAVCGEILVIRCLRQHGAYDDAGRVHRKHAADAVFFLLR